VSSRNWFASRNFNLIVAHALVKESDVTKYARLSIPLPYMKTIGSLMSFRREKECRDQKS
jgi:hypothetical protein